MTYKNLYTRDIRTPSTYFEDKDVAGEAMKKLESKLDDLLSNLYTLKEEGKGTPATKKIIDDEIKKAEVQRYKKVSKENALKVVEAFMYGTPVDAADAICAALDYKAFSRTEPYMVYAGEEMEDFLFGN